VSLCWAVRDREVVLTNQCSPQGADHARFAPPTPALVSLHAAGAVQVTDDSWGTCKVSLLAAKRFGRRLTSLCSQ
jgi:hypothetical protein